MTRPGRLLVAFALASVACRAAAAAELTHPNATVTRTSRPIRLLRSWEETVKVGKSELPGRVDVLFDYGKGEAREDFYDAHGVLRSTRRMTRNLPAPSPEEIAEAFEIVRTDPALASLFARFSVVFEGGFLLQEDPGMPCGPGSRCLHVFLLSSDRSGTIRRLVVDLVPRSIPYPVYTPSAVEAHER